MEHNGKVLLFKGESQYDALRFFTDELDRAFRALRIPTVVIDLLEPDALSRLQRELQESRFLFALGFNGVGQELRIQGESLYDMIRLPFVAFYVDHPIHHDSRLRYAFRYQVVSFVDQDLVDFANAHYPGKFVVFIPHGGSADPDVRDNPVPIHKRSVPILFAGSFQDPDAFLQSVNAPEGALRQIKSIAEIMLSGDHVNIRKATVTFLQTLGMGEEDLTPDLFPIMRLAELYFRFECRKRLILSLSNLPVTVCGNGWGQLKGAKKPLNSLPAKSFAETLRLAGDAKIFLSIAPFFRQGGHERVFSAMLSGAVAAADRSGYLDRILSPGIHYIGYRSTDPLGDLLAAVLEDPDKLQEIASEGRKQAEANHTWTHRAVAILGAVKEFLHRL